MNKLLKKLILKNLREELKNARKEQKITLQEAAKAAGMKNRAAMAHIESGRNNMKIDTFIEMVYLYGIEVELRYGDRTIIIC